MSLTKGALSKICSGGEVADPVMQVLGYKKIAGSGQERYRILLSDGQNSNSFSMLATQLNHMIHNKELEQFTVVKINKFICNQVAGQTKRVMILLELSVVTPGDQVGEKIGNPQQMSDGKAQNQNQNPNAGSAPKRPSEQPAPSEPKKPMMAASNSSTGPPRTSVLTSRPTAGTSSKEVYTPIDSITPYQNKWTIKARVTSKSDIRTWNNAKGSGKLFSMDLMDESGEIRATAFKDQCDAYYNMIEVGKVFLISNCSVKAANKQYSKLRNDYELTFKDNVIVQRCDDVDDVPTIVYQFIKIADLSELKKDDTVDVIGVLKTVDDAKDFVSRAGKEMTKRDIVLVDQSATEVNVTLWGNTAREFAGEGNTIVAVKGARVSDFSGVTLSGGDLLLNPDIQQSHELVSWWENGGSNVSTSSLSTQGGRGAVADGSNMKSIGEVKATRLGENSERGEYYSAIATTTFFNKEKALYKACKNHVDGKDCNKKVVETGDGYRCEKCNMDLDGFRWRIMLSFNIGDATDHTWTNCFQDMAEKLIGVKSDELGSFMESDEARYNALFTEATFKTYNFRIRVKEDRYNDETRLKHTVVALDEVDYSAHCKKLIKEIEEMGGQLPDKVNRQDYL